MMFGRKGHAMWPILFCLAAVLGPIAIHTHDDAFCLVVATDDVHLSERGERAFTRRKEVPAEANGQMLPSITQIDPQPSASEMAHMLHEEEETVDPALAQIVQDLSKYKESIIREDTQASTATAAADPPHVEQDRPRRVGFSGAQEFYVNEEEGSEEEWQEPQDEDAEEEPKQAEETAAPHLPTPNLGETHLGPAFLTEREADPRPSTPSEASIKSYTSPTVHTGQSVSRKRPTLANVGSSRSHELSKEDRLAWQPRGAVTEAPRGPFPEGEKRVAASSSLPNLRALDEEALEKPRTPPLPPTGHRQRMERPSTSPHYAETPVWPPPFGTLQKTASHQMHLNPRLAELPPRPSTSSGQRPTMASGPLYAQPAPPTPSSTEQPGAKKQGTVSRLFSRLTDRKRSKSTSEADGRPSLAQFTAPKGSNPAFLRYDQEVGSGATPSIASRPSTQSSRAPSVRETASVRSAEIEKGLAERLGHVEVLLGSMVKGSNLGGTPISRQDFDDLVGRVADVEQAKRGVSSNEVQHMIQKHYDAELGAVREAVSAITRQREKSTEIISGLRQELERERQKVLQLEKSEREMRQLFEEFKETMQASLDDVVDKFNDALRSVKKGKSGKVSKTESHFAQLAGMEPVPPIPLAYQSHPKQPYAEPQQYAEQPKSFMGEASHYAEKRQTPHVTPEMQMHYSMPNAPFAKQPTYGSSSPVANSMMGLRSPHTPPTGAAPGEQPIYQPSAEQAAYQQQYYAPPPPQQHYGQPRSQLAPSPMPFTGPATAQPQRGQTQRQPFYYPEYTSHSSQQPTGGMQNSNGPHVRFGP